MGIATIGKNGYKIPMHYEDIDPFKSDNKGYPRFALILIESGSGVLIFNSYEVLFTAPTIICMNENDFPKLKTSSNISAKAINFEPGIINCNLNFNNIREQKNNFSITELQDCYLLFPFIQRDFNYKGNINIDTKTAEQISKLFQALDKELVSQRDIFWPCRSRSLLLEMLILITKLFPNNEVNDQEVSQIPESVKEIIDYLHNNYQSKITLNLLARIFKTNRTTLNNQFYNATNFTIIEYLIKHRVNLAATLLRDTYLPISEITERTGFNDSTHFWRMFKKYTALSPSKYRNEYCWLYA